MRQGEREWHLMLLAVRAKWEDTIWLCECSDAFRLVIPSKSHIESFNDFTESTETYSARFANPTYFAWLPLLSINACEKDVSMRFKQLLNPVSMGTGRLQNDVKGWQDKRPMALLNGDYCCVYISFGVPNGLTPWLYCKLQLLPNQPSDITKCCVWMCWRARRSERIHVQNGISTRPAPPFSRGVATHRRLFAPLVTFELDESLHSLFSQVSSNLIPNCTHICF